MGKKNREIIRLHKEGLAVREIADLLTEDYHCVRCTLIKEGLYTPKRKYVTYKERREWLKKYLAGISIDEISPNRATNTIMKHLLEEMRDMLLDKQKKCLNDNDKEDFNDC